MRPKATSSYLDLEGLAEAEESWTKQQVEVFQLTQLRRTIQMAETCCPLYQQRFREHGVSYLDLYAPEDLAKFPVLTQDDIDSNVDGLRNQNMGRKYGRRSSDRKTAGLISSTSARGTASEQKEKVFLGQFLRRCGIKANDRIVFIWDEPSIGRAKSKHRSLNLRKRWMTMAASEITPENALAYLDKTIGHNPHAIVASPSVMVTLAIQMLEKGRKVHSDLKTIVCSGERLDKSQQTFLEETFGKRVVARYKDPSRLAAASQTLNSDLYYFSPGYGFVELSEPDANGMSEIIATSFHDDTRPLVRFKTGDLVSGAVDGRREKEFPWLAVEDFVGRSDEFLIDKSGKKVWPVRLSVDDAPFKKVVAIQLYQDKPGHVLLRYMSTNGLTEHERKQVKRRLSVALGKELIISLKETRWLPRDQHGAMQWLVRTDSAVASPTTSKAST